jgi:hypothetical protein
MLGSIQIIFHSIQPRPRSHHLVTIALKAFAPPPRPTSSTMLLFSKWYRIELEYGDCWRNGGKDQDIVKIWIIICASMLSNTWTDEQWDMTRGNGMDDILRMIEIWHELELIPTLSRSTFQRPDALTARARTARSTPSTRSPSTRQERFVQTP